MSILHAIVKEDIVAFHARGALKIMAQNVANLMEERKEQLTQLNPGMSSFACAYAALQAEYELLQAQSAEFTQVIKQIENGDF